MPMLWRLETNDGYVGVFQCGAVLAVDQAVSEGLARYYPGNMPNETGTLMWESIPYEFRFEWVCGFNSLSQLKHWFRCPYSRQILEDFRYGGERLVLRRYNVSNTHFRRGKEQVIFKQSEASILETRLPTQC